MNIRNKIKTHRLKIVIVLVIVLLVILSVLTYLYFNSGRKTTTTIINPTTKITSLGKGKYQAEVSIAPAYYFKNNIWQEITNKIGKTDDPDYPFGIDELFEYKHKQVLTTDSPPFSFKYKENYIKWTPLNTNQVRGEVNGNYTIFKNAWNGADLKLTVAGHYLKEDVLLKENHPREFKFRIDDSSNFDPLTRSLGSFFIEDPILLNNTETEEKPLSWEITQENDKYILKTTLPGGNWSGWILDPSLVLQPDGTSGVETYIRDNLATTNYGTTTSFWSGEVQNGGAQGRGLIKFDLSSLPGNVTINTATMSLYVNYERDTTDRDVQSHRLLVEFYEGAQDGAVPAGEDASVWNFRNYNGSVAWSGGAGGGSGSDYVATPTDTTTITSTGSFDWDLSADVQDFVDGSASNYGWFLYNTGEATNNSGKRFVSSDNATAAQRPKLTIDYTVNENTIAIWHMDEGTGSTIHDSTDNDNDLTKFVVAWDMQPGQSTFNRSLYFNGSGYLYDNNSTDFNFGDQGFSISGWFKHTSTLPGTQHTLLRRFNSAGFAVYMNSSGQICFAIDDDSTWDSENALCTTTNYADNNWHHFETVKNANSTITIYMDAQQVAQTAVTATAGLNSSPTTLYLGSDTFGGSYGWVGWLDEFYIYNYDRSSDEIKLDFDSQFSARFGSSVSNSLIQGIVGWWKIDEVSGTSIAESTGNGAAATLTNGSWSGGKFGLAPVFNSSTTIINAGNFSAIENLPQMTLSLWLYKTGNGENSFPFLINNLDSTDGWRLASSGSGTNESLSFRVRYSSTNLEASATTAIYSRNVWNLITMTWDGTPYASGIRYYVNGMEVALGATQQDAIGTRNDDDANVVYIGNNITSAQTLGGRLDDVRIYNRVLSPAEIQQLYNQTPGPVAYWKMDENTGTTISDSSGRENTSSAFTNDVSWTNGKFGASLSFDGTDDVVQIAEATSTDLGTLLDPNTVSAWIKTTANYAGNAYIVAKDDSGTRPYPFRLYLDSSEYACFQIGENAGSGNTPSTCGSTALNDGLWHHVAGVVDDTGVDLLRIFVDGVQVNSTTNTTTTTTANDDNISIGNGGTSYTTLDFNGQIDDVKIYNYARTSAQIIEDMNAGHPAPGSPVGSAYVYYKFDEGRDSTANNSGNGGSSLNGTITSGTWTNSGKVGKAITFTASTSVAATITDPAYTNSISLWVYPTTSAASKTIATNLTTDASSQPVYGGCTGTALSLNTWTHILAVSNGSASCSIYQNGQLTSTSTTGVTFGATLNIGATSFTGNIDEVRLYTSALTTDQAKAEYNLGKSQVLGSLSTDSSGNASWGNDRSYCPPGDTTATCSPVGEWKMDEGSWSNNCSTDSVFDTSGNANHGDACPSSTGPTSPVPGKYGNAGKFDGSDDYVLIPASSSINNIFTGGGTVTAWVNFSSSAATRDRIADKGDGNDSLNPGWLFALEDIDVANALAFKVGWNSGDGRWTTAANTISRDAWHHVALVYNNGATTNDPSIYINGVAMSLTERSTPSGSYESDASYNLILGNRSAATRTLDGSLDEVKMYDYSLTPAQIAWDYNQGAPLVHYKMDECTGATLNNSAPAASGGDSGNDATIYPQSNDNTATGDCSSGTATEMWNDGTTGKYNASLGFDGDDDYAESGAAALVSSSALTYTAVSWGAWVKTGATPNGDVLVQLGNPASATQQEFRLTTDSSGKPQCGVCSGSTCSWNSVTGTAALTTSVWTHLMCTYNGSTIKLYVNSNLDNQASHSTAITSRSTSVVSLSRDPQSPTGTYINALLDEVKIWGYDLTTQQIKTDYNAGKAVKF